MAVLLSALMIMIPLVQGNAFAQDESGVPRPPAAAAPPPPAAGIPEPPPFADNSQAMPQGQAMSADQLDQLVAPIALYPDALVAQILAAATYPTQVVEADRWRQSQGNAPAEQVAAGAERQNWDPSVKALTAFPTVLAQLDRNIQWTTDLGNAYYNQPQDVMDSIQAMRQKAEAAGQLRTTPQQVVADEGGAITIVPANPTVVYVPVYDPWTIWGTPFPPFPGYYYYPPPGIFWGGLAIGFGIGIGIGLWGHWGWGWGHWGCGWGPRWGGHAVIFNHATYVTRSTTVINRGLNRPGGPPRNFGARGAYARPAGGINRASVSRSSTGYRGTARTNRSGGYAHPGGTANHPGVNRSSTGTHPQASVNRSSASGRTGGSTGARAPRASVNRGATPAGAGHPSSSGGGHPSGGGHAGGGHSGGGHEGK